MEEGDRVRFLEWSDDEGPSCVHPLVPNDTGTVIEVITDPTVMPGASPDEPMYDVEYFKGSSRGFSSFKIVHWEEEIVLVFAPELEGVC